MRTAASSPKKARPATALVEPAKNTYTNIKAGGASPGSKAKKPKLSWDELSMRTKLMRENMQKFKEDSNNTKRTFEEMMEVIKNRKSKELNSNFYSNHVKDYDGL